MLPFLGVFILVLAFQGWGVLFQKKFKIDLLEKEWILRTTLGMAVVLAIGSFQMILNLPFMPVAVLILFSGFVFSLQPTYLSIQNWIHENKRKSFLLLTLLVIIWLSVLYKAMLSLWAYNFNGYDDYLAYFTHAKMILQKNQMIDPFSLRRLAAFGGQSYLQALYLLFAKEENLMAVDGAIGLFLAAGIFISFFKKYSRYQFILLFCSLLFIWSDHPRINTASTMIGLSILLCILRLIEPHFEKSFKDNLAFAFTLAILNSAFLSLRANYILGLGIIYLFFIFKIGLKNKWVWQVIALTLALIFPWSLQMYLSSGTVFFPVFKGYYAEKAQTFGYNPGTAWIFQMIKEAALLTALWGLIGMAALGFESKKRNLIWGVLLGYIAVLYVMVLFTFSAFDVKHAIRYAYPFFVAAFLLSLCGIIEMKNKYFKKFILLLICFSTFYFAEGIIGVEDTLKRRQYEVLSSIKYSYYKESPFQEERKIFPHIIDALKPNASVLVAVDHPFLLDFKKNNIFNIDIAGDVSPPPSIPLDKTQEMNSYLQHLGIEQVLFLSPELSKYQFNRKFWEKLRKAKKKHPFYLNWLVGQWGWISYTDFIKPMSKSLGEGYYLYDVPKK